MIKGKKLSYKTIIDKIREYKKSIKEALLMLNELIYLIKQTNLLLQNLSDYIENINDILYETLNSRIEKIYKKAGTRLWKM